MSRPRYESLARKEAAEAKFAVFRAQDCATGMPGARWQAARQALVDAREALEYFDRLTDPESGEAYFGRLQRERDEDIPY
jgi:hypothetical protein